MLNLTIMFFLPSTKLNLVTCIHNFLFKEMYFIDFNLQLKKMFIFILVPFFFFNSVLIPQ